MLAVASHWGLIANVIVVVGQSAVNLARLPIDKVLAPSGVILATRSRFFASLMLVIGRRDVYQDAWKLLGFLLFFVSRVMTSS